MVNDKMLNYKDLHVWQKSMELAKDVYGICDKLPRSEQFALSDQLRRSAVSIPSNIAEGQKRLNVAETIQFTGIALGSAAELETQLILVESLFAISTDDTVAKTVEVSKMLSGLIRALRA